MYIFDTNIFIRSKNEMPMDIWPTFWSVLTSLIVKGDVRSCVNVKAEIDRGNDELTEWLNANAPKDFFIPLDADVMFSYQKALDWANSINNFSERAKADFSEVADSFIVATAAAKGMTLVTNEKSNLMSKRRVMIPDACAALGVRYCDLNTVFRELGVMV